MYLWNKIKQSIKLWVERMAQKEVGDFVHEVPNIFGETFPYRGLRNREQRIVYKKDLTATYTYQEGEDLLAKKQDFINQYTTEEKKQYYRFTWGHRFEFSCCKAWRDHEQVERCEAQKAWRQVAKRNYHAHMCQKFMNQKTR